MGCNLVNVFFKQISYKFIVFTYSIKILLFVTTLLVAIYIVGIVCQRSLSDDRENTYLPLLCYCPQLWKLFYDKLVRMIILRYPLS